METIKIFRNEENLKTTDVVKRFKEELEQVKLYEVEEIEKLAEAYAKNPVDKFIITDTPDVEIAQGDILIWAKGTEMYNKEIGRLEHLEVTDRLILQDGDSITGDHRIVPMNGSNVIVKRGTFRPSFLNGRTWATNFAGITVESDKPFLIVHREHGNVALPAGEYMICSQIDSETMTKMAD